MIFQPDIGFSGNRFYSQPLSGCWKPEPYCVIAIPPVLTQRIERGLTKLCAHDPLSFDESDAFENLWHQVLHSCGDQDFSGYETHVLRQFEIEVVNEMHARLTLGEFISEIGHDPYLVGLQEVHFVGRYYEHWVNPMRHVFGAIGMGWDDARAFFERLNTEEPTRTYLSQMINLIGTRLQYNEAASMGLRTALINELEATGRTEEFERFMLSETKTLGIKPVIF